MSSTSPLVRILALALCLIPILGSSRALAQGNTEKGDESAGPGSPEKASNKRPPAVAIRVLALSGAYRDNPTGVDFDLFSLMGGGMEPARSFYALCDKVDELGRDEGIQHLYLDLSAPDFFLNLAQAEELSRRIHAFRETGKKVFAWLENANTAHYSVAAACDTVLMADLGTLDFPSLSLSALHFRDAMDLFGARASVARAGDYKGAVEPFLLSEMSGELKAHYKEMLISMNDALTERVAAGRKMQPIEVRRCQGERIFSAKSALEAGLVDRLASHGTGREAVAAMLNRQVTWVFPPRKQVKPPSFFELMGKLMAGAGAGEKKGEQASLAVLHLDGMIIDGETEQPGALVSGPTVKAILELEKDSRVKGVVARINSPGGSATASEAIRKALERLASVKPVQVSMGEMAASGGYWVACVGRPIFAEPGTITGSIGAFALKLSFGPLLKRIGIHVENVTLDESASAMSLDRGWSPGEQRRVQALLDEMYAAFLEKVARSRKMEGSRVAEIASGRVWSGTQAKELGLVDHLGGLEEALEAVAEEADLKPGYAVIHRPVRKNFFELLNLFDDSEEQLQQMLAPAGVRKTLLERSGFKLSAALQLFKASLADNPTRVWLLFPAELQIK